MIEMNLKTRLAVFVLVIWCSIVSVQSIECEKPWQRVNDNVCLLLNSGIKTFNHAKFLCNFYDSEVLFIENQQEADDLKNYLNNLIRYRFNQKPYLWLDARREENSDVWRSSKSNEKINYTNWAKNSPLSNDIRSKILTCSCFRLKDGLWKDCDCETTNHFICRKTNETKIDRFSKQAKGSMNPTLSNLTDPIPSPLELLMKISMDKLNVSFSSLTSTTTTTLPTPSKDLNNTTTNYPDLPEVITSISTTTPYSFILGALRNNSNFNLTSLDDLDKLELKNPSNILLKIEDAFNFLKPVMVQPVDPTTIEGPMMLDENGFRMLRLMNSKNIPFTSPMIEETPSMSRTLSLKSNERQVESETLLGYRVRSRTKELSNEEKGTIILSKLMMNEEDRAHGSFVRMLEHEGSILVPTANSVDPEARYRGRLLLRKLVSKSSDAFYLFDCPNGFGFYSIYNTNCTKYKRCDDWNNNNGIQTIYQCLNDSVFSFTKLKCVSKQEYACEETVEKFVSH